MLVMMILINKYLIYCSSLYSQIEFSNDFFFIYKIHAWIKSNNAIGNVQNIEGQLKMVL